MNLYIVVEKPLFLSNGIVELTNQQYQARKLFLKSLKKKGQYEVIGSICFKVGEKIGYDGKVDKVIHCNLVTPEEYAKGADAGEPEIDLEKTVEALRAELEAKDEDLEAKDKELEARAKELIGINIKLEKLTKNQPGAFEAEG